MLYEGKAQCQKHVNVTLTKVKSRESVAPAALESMSEMPNPRLLPALLKNLHFNSFPGDSYLMTHFSRMGRG